jgi:hypothetical protein
MPADSSIASCIHKHLKRYQGELSMKRINAVLMGIALLLSLSAGAFAAGCCGDGASCCKGQVCCKNKK